VRPILPKILGQQASIGAKSPILNRHSLVAPKPLHLAKSSININRKSIRAFQWALDDHRTLPLSPPKGDSKTQNGRYPSKIALRLKKVCYKVSLCEKQSCLIAFQNTVTLLLRSIPFHR